MKQDKIFILTKDDYYFIIEKNILEKCGFFAHIFGISRNYGMLKNPIFLKNINSKYFTYIKKYLFLFENKSDSFNEELCNETDTGENVFYREEDNIFFTEILKPEDNNEELVKTLELMKMDTLMKKLKYFNYMK